MMRFADLFSNGSIQEATINYLLRGAAGFAIAVLVGTVIGLSGEVMTTSIGLGQTLIMGRDLADINQVINLNDRHPQFLPI